MVSVSRMVHEAVAAAERVLTDTVKGKLAEDFIDKGIAEVKAKLN